MCLDVGDECPDACGRGTATLTTTSVNSPRRGLMDEGIEECIVEDVLRNGKGSKYGGTWLCSFGFFSEVVSQRESMISHPQFYTTSVRRP